MPPAATVVLVTYRSRQHLPACLDALPAGAAGLELEVVAVDNASGDGGPQLVRERYPHVRVIENGENRGFAAAANQGARGAMGRHLLLLNPDTVVSPGSLRTLVEALDGDPSSGLVGPQLLDPDGSPQPSAWMAPGLRSLVFDALMLHNFFPRSRLHSLAAGDGTPRVVDALSGACLLVRRASFESLGGLDDGFFLYYEDIDLCLRARAAGYGVRLVPSSRVVHVLGGSAFQDRRDFFLRFHESRRRFIRKHHPGARGRLLSGIHLGGLAFRTAVYAAAGALAGSTDLRQRASHHAAALRRLVAGGPP